MLEGRVVSAQCEPVRCQNPKVLETCAWDAQGRDGFTMVESHWNALYRFLPLKDLERVGVAAEVDAAAVAAAFAADGAGAELCDIGYQ